MKCKKHNEILKFDDNSFYCVSCTQEDYKAYLKESKSREMI